MLGIGLVIWSIFGPLSDWVTEKLTQADQASLEQWGDRVLDARILEEVFAEG